MSLCVAAVGASSTIPTRLFLPAYCSPNRWRQSDLDTRRIDQEMERGDGSKVGNALCLSVRQGRENLFMKHLFTRTHTRIVHVYILTE